MNIRIEDLQIGSALSIIHSRWQDATFVTVVKMTKTQTTMSDGSRWSFSKYSGTKKLGGYASDASLVTTEEAVSFNEHRATKSRINSKLGRISRTKMEWLPESTLDAIIAALDAQRQIEADAAEGAYQETGHAY